MVDYAAGLLGVFFAGVCDLYDGGLVEVGFWGVRIRSQPPTGGYFARRVECGSEGKTTKLCLRTARLQTKFVAEKGGIRINQPDFLCGGCLVREGHS